MFPNFQSSAVISEREVEISTLKHQIEALEAVLRQSSKLNKSTLSTQDTVGTPSLDTASKDSEPAPGTEVILQGLETRADLNGRTGVVMADTATHPHCPGKLRLLVAMPNGDVSLRRRRRVTLVVYEVNHDLP